MTAEISKSVLSGKINAISSKSDAHRLLICAALSDAPACIELNAFSDDIYATQDCLCALGAKIEKTHFGFHVTPIKEVPRFAELNAKESGSTLRFLLPVCAALGVNAKITGEGRLPKRPIGELTNVLMKHNVSVTGSSLPLQISGKLIPGEYEMPGNISSQYLTGLMFALPLVGNSVLKLTTKLESAGYVDMTLSALKKFGVNIEIKDGTFLIPSAKYTSCENVTVEGDWSNSAFFLVAGALKGSVSVSGLNMDSAQGDKAVVDILKRMGAHVEVDGDIVTVKSAPLKGCEIDVSGIPDLLPVLSVAASCAEGETRFINASRLRIKESDRLSSTACMINSLGGLAEEHPDALTVKGLKGFALKGGRVDSFNDHRIAMSAAIASVICSDKVTINGAEAVNKSYPAFFKDFNSLGGRANVI